MKRFIILLLALFCLNPVFACLNSASLMLKDGTFLYDDREGNVPYGHEFYKDAFGYAIRQLDSLYKATKDIDYLSDKGLVLILTQDYDAAIRLFLEIEKSAPGRYATAANLGTAYELSGQNDLALQWIKKAVEIDPASHSNSEWIHVNILEAKIKGEQWYTSDFLLRTNFGTEVQPGTSLTPAALQELSDALYYQLNERISFVKPPEKIVGQLLFDLGNIAFFLGNYEDALADYDLADLYGYTGQLIDQRVAETKKQLRQANKPQTAKQASPSYLPYILVILTLMILLILLKLLYKRKQQDHG
ncbi:MAG: hypothetical protein BGO09_00670 [Bacteroidetes bacterium 47-18]|nr:MAG: hypothetical protein BGO09_00670 [Bacteroidetes bacterium 47-18]